MGLFLFCFAFSRLFLHGIDSLDGLNGFNNHVKTYKLAWCILSTKRILVNKIKKRRKKTTAEKIVWNGIQKGSTTKTKAKQLQMGILLNHTRIHLNIDN